MTPREELGQNSWTEYRKLVMQTLEQLAEEIKGLKDDLSKDIKDNKREIEIRFDRINKRLNDFELQVTVDVTTLKTKAAVWGGIFGALLGAVASGLVQLLIQKLSH